MKTDSRTQYTKKVIRECFFTLLKDNPLNKITVKGICELAQINRTTFYRYYLDVYDLLEQIEADIFSSFQRDIRQVSSRDPSQTIRAIMDATLQNEELYLLLRSSSNHAYLDHVIGSCYTTFQDGFATRYPGLSAKQQEWLYQYVTHGCVSIVLDWINRGMKEDPQEVAAFMTRLNDQLLTELAQRHN